MEAMKGMYCSELAVNHACAYCDYHKCHMTAQHIRCKDCLNKQCKHLIKNEARRVSTVLIKEDNNHEQSKTRSAS